MYAVVKRGSGAAVLSFLRRNTVAVIAGILAVVSMFFIHPDAQYAGYFDFKTLACLFCTLAVICALKNIHFFSVAARRIILMAGNLRSASLLLVYVTFIGSMLIANDMALLTFLPLGCFVLTSSGKEKYMAPVFIFQNIAANLGGMLTPFGNPQNLYLYSKFNIGNAEFISIMLLPFAVSIALITLCCFIFIPRETLTLIDDKKEKLPVLRTVLYCAVFVYDILAVMRVVPYLSGLAVTAAVLLVADRRALLSVDYPLLFTFAAFFVFAGNISRLGFVNTLLTSLLAQSTLLTSVVSCQLISNVPSAILLSRFTANYRALLVGVNIGGVGTLISSLASLITFREYTSRVRGKTLQYIGIFSAFNFSFLLILTALMYFFV